MVGTRHCYWGECKTDSRYPEKWPESLKELEKSAQKVFIPFPKRAKELAKCKRWLVACSREFITEKNVNNGTAMGTKMAVVFANVFMAKIEKGIISKSKIKPLVRKRYIDDVFCVWHTTEDNIENFVQRANNYHDTIKFTAEISYSEITFLDTKLFKGDRFNRESTLDVQTHYKRTETFQYTNFYSCHPPGVTKGFIKGEALRLLRTNSSIVTFNNNMQSFKTRLKNRGYPSKFSEKFLSEVNFTDRERSLENKDNSTKKKILPFVTQYHPALPNLKNIIINGEMAPYSKPTAP